MEEFLFEESLLESMEVISYDERDINEVVRENAHALLDAETDMVELLYESDIVLESGGDKKSIIQRMLDKIKEFIRKLKNWVTSIIKKKENIDKEQSKNTNTPQKQTMEEPDNIAEYNKAIESKTVTCEVIDSDRIISEFNKILSTLEKITQNILSGHHNRDDIERMITSISVMPDFKSFIIEKRFQLKDFITSKDLDTPYHLRVPMLYFKEEFSNSIDVLYKSSHRVHDLISDTIDRVDESDQIDCLQKCTTILGKVSHDVSAELDKIMKQVSVLGSAVKSCESKLRKKYNL